ncbi:MAG: hypothetical protein ABSE76_01680 [Minisyncoccia bacterium]|jgi:hypothetical protein
MTKKILYLILGAILAFGILFLLWSWLFSGGGSGAQNNGQFGTAGNANQNGISSINSNNGETNLGQNTNNGTNAANGTITLGNNGAGNNNGTGGSSGTVTVNNGTTGATLGTMSSVPGVIWLGSPFNATGINGLSSGAGGFTPTITTTNNPGNGGTTLLEALAATAIAGSLTCAIQAGLVTLSTGASTAGVVSMQAAALIPPVPGVSPGPEPNIVADYGLRQQNVITYTTVNTSATAKNTGGFVNCITNVIAKVALQQITNSVVNWINSGFHGQPSFVTNFQQFFTNVADIAAGQFIQGGPLSFLCSPFQLQIKIAVAQSYANRGAMSCTLTKVINNVNSFMNGNFSQGGWPGLLSFTTTPTNNPYGAYAYAQIGLVTAQQNAIANAKNNISPTGFLNSISFGQAQSCNNVTTINSTPTALQNSQAARISCPSGCTCSVATPGSVIEASLDKTLGSGIDQLGLANDIDQIINALITQLMTRMLQNGLSSLSQTTTQTPADIAAESQATSLLNDIQSNTTIAEQLGSIYQGSISDIQSAQANLNNLANCWSSVAASTNNASAAQNAATASTTIQSLESQVTVYNNDITQVNNAIATLNQFALQISSAASDADVSTATASYNAAVSAGTFPSQTDLTTAEQNRTTLQSSLAATNTSTQSSLEQCQALVQ